jgi:hypothetical protein
VERRLRECKKTESREVIESYEGAGYSQGLRGADGKDRGGGGGVAECRIGYFVSRY